MAVASSFEQRKVARQLRTEGATWPEIAEVMRTRYGLAGLAAARQAHGWSQSTAAGEWCARWPDHRITQETLSGWECWPHSGRQPTLRTVERLAQLYELSASDLFAGWADYRGTAATARYDPGVDRRQFLSATAAGAASLALPHGPGRVGAADLDALRSEVTRLWHLDERDGGAAVHRAAVGQLDGVRGLLDRASFRSETHARSLQSIAGSLQELAGFTAYDAGDHDTARRFFHEALTTARVADDDDLAVYVFAQLANQATYLRNGGEAVELAQAAQRCARRFAPPRLMSVLAVWEAEGHGLRGDTPAAHDALSRAETEMGAAGPDGDVWFAYFTPDMLATSAARTLLALGQPVAAERCARDSVSPALARRPLARNRITHAHTLAACGRLDEASHVTVQAAAAGRGVSSARMRAELATLRPVLEAHPVPGAAEVLASL